MLEKYRYYGKNEKGKLFKRVLTLAEIESGAYLVWVKEYKIIQNTVTRDRFTGVVDNNNNDIFYNDTVRYSTNVFIKGKHYKENRSLVIMDIGSLYALYVISTQHIIEILYSKQEKGEIEDET